MKNLLLLVFFILTLNVVAQSKKELEITVQNLNTEVQKLTNKLEDNQSKYENCFDDKAKMLKQKDQLMTENMNLRKEIDSLNLLLQNVSLGKILSPKNQSDSIKMVLQQFYSAPGIEERYKFVYQDTLILEKMKNWYSNGVKTREIKSDDIAIEVKPCDIYTALYKNRIFYFFQSKNGYALDWESAVGYNDVALNTFKANSSIKDVTVRATVTILNYYNYNYEGKEAQYWSIRIVDSNYDEVYGYVSKTSELGKKIYNLISDGKEHSVIFEIRSDRSADTTGNIVIITNLVSESWLR